MTDPSRFRSPGSVSGDVVTVVSAVVCVEPDDVICMIDAVVEVVAAERDVDAVVVTVFPVDDVVTLDPVEIVVSVGFVTVVVVTVTEALLTEETVVCVIVVVLVDSVC